MIRAVCMGNEYVYESREMYLKWIKINYWSLGNKL